MRAVLGPSRPWKAIDIFRFRFLAVFLCLLVSFVVILRVFFSSADLVTAPSNVYFVAMNFYNNEPLLPHFRRQLLRLVDMLGAERVYVSVFENGSVDGTRVQLQMMSEELSALRLAGFRFTFEDRKRCPFVDRIEYMARVRNRAMEYLTYDSNAIRLTSGPNVTPLIVFLNDIFFFAEDIVRLIKTNSGRYDMVCAMDYYSTFYDSWVTRDITGHMFEDFFPHTNHHASREKLARGVPTEVYSCWNGAVVMSAVPFMRKDLRFRSNDPGTCYHSECFLVCEDLRALGYDRIFVNPAVRVSYEPKYYYLHNYLMKPLEPFLLLMHSWKHPSRVTMDRQVDFDALCTTRQYDVEQEVVLTDDDLFCTDEELQNKDLLDLPTYVEFPFDAASIFV
eukprot:ANDGO_04918.mRNA.1 hypothetical protein